MKTRKKKSIFLILLVCACICAGLFLYQNQPTLHVAYEMILPEGFDCIEPDPAKSDCQILYNGEVVGGILTCPYPRKFLKSTQPPRIVPLDLTLQQSDIILQAMKNADAPGAGGKRFDLSIQTCSHCDYLAWFGNQKEEYEHHLFLLDDGVVSLWFDLKEIGKTDADRFASGFSVKYGGFQ